MTLLLLMMLPPFSNSLTDGWVRMMTSLKSPPFSIIDTCLSDYAKECQIYWVPKVIIVLTFELTEYDRRMTWFDEIASKMVHDRASDSEWKVALIDIF